MGKTRVVHLESKPVDSAQGFAVPQEFFGYLFRAANNQYTPWGDEAVKLGFGNGRPAAFFSQLRPKFGITGIIFRDSLFIGRCNVTGRV